MHRVRTPLCKQPDLQRRRQERERLDAVDLHAGLQRHDWGHALAAWVGAAEYQLKMARSKFTASLLEQVRGLARRAERKPRVRLLACASPQDVTDGLHGKLGRERARTALVQNGKLPILCLRRTGTLSGY